MAHDILPGGAKLIYTKLFLASRSVVKLADWIQDLKDQVYITSINTYSKPDTLSKFELYKLTQENKKIMRSQPPPKKVKVFAVHSESDAASRYSGILKIKDYYGSTLELFSIPSYLNVEHSSTILAETQVSPERTIKANPMFNEMVEFLK